jgi:hypothetical protein
MCSVMPMRANLRPVLASRPKKIPVVRSITWAPSPSGGNGYLRTLLVQGAQSVVTVCQRRDDAVCLLARRLLAQGKRRKVVVLSVANRMACIMCAIIKHGERYRPEGKWAAKAAHESTVSTLTAAAAKAISDLVRAV